MKDNPDTRFRKNRDLDLRSTNLTERKRLVLMNQQLHCKHFIPFLKAEGKQGHC